MTTSRQFYHPTSRRILSSQDVTFDESVSYYPLFPYRTASLPPPPLFVAPGTPSVDPLPPHGPAPSGVSQVDPAEPVEVAVDSGAARGAEPAGAGTGGVGPGVAVSEGAKPGGAEPERVEPGGAGPGGAESGSAEPGGAEPERANFGGPLAAGGASGAAGGAYGAGAAGGAASAGAARAAGGTAGAGATGAAGPGGTGAGGTGAIGVAGGAGAAGPGGARTGGTGAAGAGGASGVGAASAGAVATGGPAGVGAVVVTGAGGAAGVVAGDPGAEGTGAVSAVSGVAAAVLRSAPSAGSWSSSSFTESTACPSRSESDSLRAASPIVTRFLATAVTNPLFDSPAASAIVAELADFVAACRLDYATSLVAESASASVCPPSVEGECALGTDVLEDRQEEFECFAAAVPHLVSMLLTLEGDSDAPDIPTPRSYAEAIEGPYSSQWQAAMEAEMASWKSTGTYVGEVPLPGANIVSGMWIFRVKRPPGSPPVFKARYVPRGFSQRQGVDFFQTFSPTPKMTILQGSLHEEIWLRRPPGFTGSFLAGTQWSLRRPVYGLRQAPREWHDTLRTTLAALDGLVFGTADTEALAHVKSELRKRHTCTNMGELTSYLGLRITRDRAQRTIILTQSHMVQQVLQRFGFTYSLPQSTPLPTGHSLSAPPSDESVEPSGPYPELVGCLMYLITCTRPDLAYPLSILARYVAPVRRAWGSCLEDGVHFSSLVTHMLPGTKHIALHYFLARELQQRG
ncbi:unnamed protein product [Closterium sp. NIES-53]